MKDATIPVATTSPPSSTYDIVVAQLSSRLALCPTNRRTVPSTMDIAQARMGGNGYEIDRDGLHQWLAAAHDATGSPATAHTTNLLRCILAGLITIFCHKCAPSYRDRGYHRRSVLPTELRTV